jgi:SWI/SNF-related matrix-associated actin-dependent regulator of chromatin subfamily A3
MGDLIEPPPPTEMTQAPVRREENEDLNGIRTGSSAKIDMLVHLLRLSPSDEKSLVFSQFTGFLDKVCFLVVYRPSCVDNDYRTDR